MVDPYLLTAPVLLLGIVVLLRFVGCGFANGAAATGLTAEACDGKVNLNWMLDGPASYQITRDGTQLVTKYPDTSYTDTNVTNGTTYSYKVTNSSRDSNTVSATPAALPGRPPGSTINTNSPLYQNLIGLFLMNDGGQTDGGPADDTNIVDGNAAAHSGATPPTWVLADPSIWFHGGSSLNSYLDAGAHPAFYNMPTSKITIVAKVLLDSSPGGICEKNDGEQGMKDSGFRFGVTSSGALRFAVELALQGNPANMVIQSSDNAVPVQTWVQVAFTWDGTQSTTQNPGPSSAAALYINGALRPPNAAATTNGSGTLDNSQASNNNSFRIGNADYGADMSSFYGKMAYMAIYKGRLLTTSDMMTLDANLGGNVDANLPINYPANLNPCSG